MTRRSPRPHPAFLDLEFSMAAPNPRRALPTPRRGALYSNISRRVGWLNQSLFACTPADNKPVNAAAGRGVTRATELLNEIEEKAGVIRDPSSCIKAVRVKQDFRPPEFDAPVLGPVRPDWRVPRAARRGRGFRP